MPLPELETIGHSFTSCTDEDLNNLGYCTRCNTIAFLQRDRYRDALEFILPSLEGIPTLEAIVCEALSPNPPKG